MNLFIVMLFRKMTVGVKQTNEKTSKFVKEELRMKTLVYQMLVRRVISACYVGRFYVEQLKSYRYLSNINIIFLLYLFPVITPFYCDSYHKITKRLNKKTTVPLLLQYP